MDEEEKKRKLEPEATTVLEVGVVQSADAREISKIEAEAKGWVSPLGRVVPWQYRHFIEGVATAAIVKDVGADPNRIARVFHKKDEATGKDQVHVVGSPDVVKEIANGLEATKRELHTWYIGEAETVEEEREAVKPALRQLIIEIPHSILSDQDIKEIATRVAHEALEETAKALNEFKQGGENDKD
ncbi:hypothetical protein ES703_73557 [subsurface metagenome]